MNGKYYHDQVCEKLNIPIEKQIKKIPSDKELNDFFDIFYKDRHFDDEAEFIAVQGGFVRGYFFSLYNKSKQ
jgi:hypothetical protein